MIFFGSFLAPNSNAPLLVWGTDTPSEHPQDLRQPRLRGPPRSCGQDGGACADYPPRPAALCHPPKALQVKPSPPKKNPAEAGLEVVFRKEEHTKETLPILQVGVEPSSADGLVHKIRVERIWLNITALSVSVISSQPTARDAAMGEDAPSRRAQCQCKPWVFGWFWGCGQDGGTFANWSPVHLRCPTVRPSARRRSLADLINPRLDGKRSSSADSGQLPGADRSAEYSRPRPVS
jgi:hypothetical protein